MSSRVDISHSDIVELRIPVKCLGIYHINCDFFSVDKRRVRRHIRRAMKTYVAPSLLGCWQGRLRWLMRRCQ